VSPAGAEKSKECKPAMHIFVSTAMKQLVSSDENVVALEIRDPESHNMQFETVCFNGVLITSFVSNLTKVVLKLYYEISLLRNDNAVLVELIDKLTLYSYVSRNAM
jgi:hypothetical protein